VIDPGCRSVAVGISAAKPVASSLVSKPCRFCGTTDRQITNEHVWPEWLADFLPNISQPGHSERWSSGAGRQRWRQPLLTSTVRAFCNACNAGWMSDIENAAKPIIGPMVRGLAATLDASAQRAVANWAVLKGLVAVQTSQNEQPIPERHYAAVYSARGAHPGMTRIWIGRRQNLADPITGSGQLFASHFMPLTNVVAGGFPRPPELNRYISSGGVFFATIFQVGHFFAMALHHDWPGLEVRTRAVMSFLSIWPGGSTVRWPPPEPVDDLGDPHQITQFFMIRPPAARAGGDRPAQET
jgi:hypothetical protein